MLELRHIKKTYHVGDVDTHALNDISVSFREKEFVAILGTSGSGKTTCLNIIGGLDRYDSGDLIIKGKSTKNFSDKEWDAYRNNTIGFIFQSYNLITHLSIVANVEMGMTLSGVSKAEKHKRALEVLEQVGLKEHLHKKPNQLSGGQMQRVAIARALANDPEILLCDEPTGALDTETSVQIMDLIQEVAKDKLVIMVTHNPELAKEYATRVVEFKDGCIQNDTNPYEIHTQTDGSAFKLKKTSMRFTTALGLSLNNLKTKIGRTTLTSFASSIGIIGIAMILSLSTGFQAQIDAYQQDAMAEFPIIISQSAMNMDMEQMAEMQQAMHSQASGKQEFTDAKEIYLYDPVAESFLHTNKITDDYMDYVQNVDKEICDSIGYLRLANMNLVREINGTYTPVRFGSSVSEEQSMTSVSSMSSAGLASFPTMLDDSAQGYLEENYDLLAGSYPQDITDVVLLIDSKNRLDYTMLNNLGFDYESDATVSFDDIIGTQMKLIDNNDYYAETPSPAGTGTVFLPSDDYETMYQSENSIPLTISGIVRLSEDSNLGLLGSGIVYSDDLVQLVIDRGEQSDIVKAQKNADYNVMSMEQLDEATKEQTIAYLGGDSVPFMIMMYPTSFEAEQDLTAYLDEWNAGKSKEDVIIYTDLAQSISDMTSGIMDAITLVLIAFAGISLVVSLIMICIIIYTSVLERTKEIGILKALGARKKDISRVFDAETCLLGVFSGTLGIVIAEILIIPTNRIIYSMTELSGVAHLNPLHAIFLIALSTALTMLGGHIPARMAAKKDAVEALRSE